MFIWVCNIFLFIVQNITVPLTALTGSAPGCQPLRH